MALSTSQIEEMYEVAKRVHDGVLTRAQALLNLELKGVPRVQAADCIYNFRKMRCGVGYTRTLTGATTAHFLARLNVDFPVDGLERALVALRAHINYLESKRGSACRQERRLLDDFSASYSTISAVSIYPDEVTLSEFQDQKFLEGAMRQVFVNQYERDPRARSACIRHWGIACYVCGFDFLKTYGEMGRGFIHVHHLTEISAIGTTYEIDPRTDLRPVCPNCHAMLHTQRPAIDIEELKTLLGERVGSGGISAQC